MFNANIVVRLIPVSADFRSRTTSRVASTTGVETLSGRGGRIHPNINVAIIIIWY